ncbi:hypothetical protein PTTG_12062 [Puccinia triticina 1-1 BBBD Race 1]|uniref:Uncharacterized protein n=2 Tax=Puccinia triticina TaxID=208348 RepID=A0A180GKN5_PUCT1|nr:uncharacterized protein PtA15_18A84 [Puccinia triticina]OAV92533.1 hypothetical protein PTTG_12062 [Puccinia triticina 1-1 BBBD Race 1]WAQ93028.1 hypothetical protein PtA15_18A84 [Puccinia triticina]WAR63010.1 hypothetical protein PtB15_18B92 [Puccinia triticina]
MASGQGLASYTRPTSTRAPFRGLFCLLTCLLYWKNVQCAYENDPNSSHTWAQLMQESDHLHDFDHFATRPFTLPGSQTFVIVNSKRPRESEMMQESDYLHDFKRFATGPGFTLPESPPFEIFNSQRPQESDEQLIFEAIRSLRLKSGSRLIGNERKDEYKMLKIEEGQVSRFLSQLVNEKGNKISLNQIGKARLPDVSKEQYLLDLKNRRRSVVQKFIVQANRHDHIYPLRSLYTDRVDEIKGSMDSLQAEIRSIHPPPVAEYLEADLQRIMKTLPIYFFHVDLINTLIPAQGVETFKSQRQAAWQQFYEHVQGLIKNPSVASDRTRKVGTPVLYKLNLDITDSIAPFYWTILGKWIGSSRTSLARSAYTCYNTRYLNHDFKYLINEIFACYVEKFDQMPIGLS